MSEVGTVNQRIRSLAEENPQQQCYKFISVKNEILSLSRQQLFDLSRRFASRLQRHDIKKGDVICSVLTNSRSRIIMDMGILMAGGVVLTGLPVLSDGQDLFGALRHSNCSMVITSSASPTAKIFERYGLSSSVGEKGKLNSHQDHTAFISSLADEHFYEADVNADDEAYIFMTSGSTGFSKMVPRTHRECLDLADNHCRIFTQDDVLYSDRPFGWLGGFPHFYLTQGIPTLVQEVFNGVTVRDVSDIWGIVLNLGATFTFMPVPDVMLLRQHYADHIFKKSIKVILTGGQPIKKNVVAVVGQVCDVMMTVYGSTDAGLITYGLISIHNKERFKDCRAGNILCPGLQLRLVDENTKQVFTEPNRVGIIHLKGRTVLRRYLNVETTTSDMFTKDGWLDTNDAGYIDDKGGLYVIGRQSDVIVVGPYNMYPQWMEERIQKCPGVQSVMIVGLPHPVTSQELCVCVIKEKDAILTLAELETFCRGMFLPGATKFDGVPEKFVFMDSFPHILRIDISGSQLGASSCCDPRYSEISGAL
ncbi:2-succinylbenzoate--CoA ligase-like [Physella acuta]|uniref:2-succinylbenzoate--CoA ligase-like n=1 Tax=Physella acuta TaxID=109671 RepID=UPI0027DD4757|nr:2-succinylbenzoate--CoA ligase-like [Physella acuta]